MAFAPSPDVFSDDDMLSHLTTKVNHRAFLSPGHSQWNRHSSAHQIEKTVVLAYRAVITSWRRMLSVSDVDKDLVVAGISWRIQPGPLVLGRPVLHYPPGIARRGALQPEPVEDRIFIDISGRSRPSHWRSGTLWAGPVGSKSRQPGWLIGDEEVRCSQCTVIAGCWIVPTIPDVDIDCIGSSIVGETGPGPLVFGRPVLHYLPGVACGGSLQPESVLQFISIGICSHCCPYNWRTCSLRSWVYPASGSSESAAD